MGGTTSRVIVHPPVCRTVSRAETGCGHMPLISVISAASYPVLVTGRPQVSSGMEKPVTEIFCHRPAIAVRERGVEPPRPEGHWHLKPARLPFRHSRIGPARTQLEKISTKMTAVENRGRTASPVPGFTSLGSSPTSSLVLVRPRLMRSHGVSGTPWWCAVCGSSAARCANFPSAQEGSDEDSHQHAANDGENLPRPPCPLWFLVGVGHRRALGVCGADRVHACRDGVEGFRHDVGVVSVMYLRAR